MESTMKISRGSVLSLLQSLLALVLGFAAVSGVNVMAGRVLTVLLPGSLDTQGLPLTAQAQGAYLPILFLAGMAGAFVVVLVAPRAPVVHAVVFGVLALVADIGIVAEYREIWPLWFSALVVLTVPPQVWLGAVLGLRARRRWAPWGRPGSEPAAPTLAMSRASARDHLAHREES
jgi:hypothetical protein